MVSGAHKVWTNAVLRTGPATMLGRSLFCLDQAERNESFADAFACRGTEAIRLKAALLAFACIERFICVPEPPVIVGISIREVAERDKKISLGVRECATQTIIIEYRMRSYKKVRVLIVPFPVRLIHIVHYIFLLLFH